MPAKKTSDEEATPSPAPATKKRKALVISSDEDEIPASPQVSKHGKELKKSRKVLETKSPRNENGHNTKKPSLSKLKDASASEVKKPLKRVNPSDLFGGETKRVEAPKPKERSLIEMEDEAIDRSLMDVDEETEVNKSIAVISPSPKKANKVSNPESSRKRNTEEPKTTSAKKSKASTPRAKAEKHSDLETSVLTDEERHERKRMAAALYQKYKNRSSCLNPGSKEIPKGSPDCLKGLTFLVTGILESMERDEAASVIKGFGGRVMTVVGKKLNYLVVGEEAGPKKLAQAEEHNITILSEDGLFDLIREKSGETKPKVEENIKVRKESELPKIKKEVTEEKSSSCSSKHTLKPEPKKESSVSPKIKKEPKKSPMKVTEIKKEPKKSPMKVAKVEPLPRKDAETVSPENMAWVDKYKPTSIKEIVGQAGPASNVTK